MGEEAAKQLYRVYAYAEAKAPHNFFASRAEATAPRVISVVRMQSSARHNISTAHVEATAPQNIFAACAEAEMPHNLSLVRAAPTTSEVAAGGTATHKRVHYLLQETKI